MVKDVFVQIIRGDHHAKNVKNVTQPVSHKTAHKVFAATENASIISLKTSCRKNTSHLYHQISKQNMRLPSLLYMSLCQKVLSKDCPFWGCKYFFRFTFSLNKPNFIRKSIHQRDNKDKLDSQSQFWVSKIWKLTRSLGRKSVKEGWTFRVHRFSCFVCIFLLQAIFPLLLHRT